MKAIRMTPEMESTLAAQILAQIAKKNFVEDSKITLDFDSAWEKKKGAIKLNYTLEAWTKQKALVDAFNSEIGWNGLVRKTGPYSYECYDILVFPQSVSGSTVRTDQEKYQVWAENLNDEQFNNMRMNAHSHVNMAPIPSGQDLSDQQRIVDTLYDDDFYFIFIWNKKEDYTVKFVDMTENVIYEGDEIEITIDGGTWRKDFVETAKKMLDTVTPVVGAASGGALVQSKSPKAKRHNYGNYNGAMYSDDEDDEDPYGYYDRYGTYIYPGYNQKY